MDDDIIPKQISCIAVQCDARIEQFSLPEGGDVFFIYPKKITPESLKDVTEWGSLIIRKMRRAAGVKEIDADGIMSGYFLSAKDGDVRPCEICVACGRALK